MNKKIVKSSFLESFTGEQPLKPLVVLNSAENIDNDKISEELTEITIVKKKANSKNYTGFIEKIIELHNEKAEKTNEKTSLHTTPAIHYKLKLISIASKVNLLDLTNAILTSYIEENKGEIDVLLKKMTL